MIILTRFDSMLGVDTPITRDECADWDAVAGALTHYEISQFSGQQLSDFHAEQPADTITFERREFVNCGVSAYSANVRYVIDAGAAG